MGAHLVGTPERIAARLAEYVESGITELCAIFYAPDDESTERQTHLFAEEVMPQLGVTPTSVSYWHWTPVGKREDPMNERATRSSLQGSQ